MKPNSENVSTRPSGPFKITRAPINSNSSLRKSLPLLSSPPFICSEPVIEFLDFDPLEAYCKDLVLTNVTSSSASVRFSAMDKRLAALFELRSEPSNRVAPGKEVRFRLSFFPQIKQNFDSHLELASEGGVFRLPLKCRYRATEAKLSADEIDFGETICGEKSSRSVTIENLGGLTSKIWLKSDAGRELKVPQIERLLAYSAQKMTFEFSPSVVGPWESKCEITFEQELDQPPLCIALRGVCVDRPIRTDKEEYDMGILLQGGVYREKVVVSNASGRSGRVEFRVPEELAGLVSVSPGSGPVAAGGTLSVWLRIEAAPGLLVGTAGAKVKGKGVTGESTGVAPRESSGKSQGMIVGEGAKKEETEGEESQGGVPEGKRSQAIVATSGQVLSSGSSTETDVRRFVVMVSTTIQVSPAEFSVRFQLTDDTLIFPTSIDFGEVPERSSRAQPLRLENRSLLPQKVSLAQLGPRLGLSPPVNLIIIPPGETVTPLLVFRAASIGDNENRAIKLRIIVGEEKVKEVFVKVRGRVSGSPLRPSAYRLDLPSIPPDQIVEHFFSLQNTSDEDLEFFINVPDRSLAGLTIEPAGGSIGPKRTLTTLVQFNPGVRDPAEARRRFVEAAASRDARVAALRAAVAEAARLASALPPPGKASSLEKEKLEEKRRFFAETAESANKQLEERLKDIEEMADVEKLSKLEGGKFDELDSMKIAQWAISIVCRARNSKSPQSYVSWLQVVTATQPKHLVSTIQEIKFGDVPIFGRKIEKFELKNEGSVPLKVEPDSCSLGSTFAFLSRPEEIPPQTSRTFHVAFEPRVEGEFYSVLELKGECACRLAVSGRGLVPKYELDAQEVEDLGLLSLGEKKTKKFLVKNTSNFSLDFRFSRNQSFGSRAEGFLRPIEVFPAEFSLAEGQTKEIQVFFNPTRQGEVSAEKFNLLIQGKPTKRFVTFLGICPQQTFAVNVLPDSPSSPALALVSLLSKEFELKKISREFSNESIFATSTADQKNFLSLKVEAEQKAPVPPVVLTPGFHRLWISSTSLPVEFDFAFSEEGGNLKLGIEPLKGKIAPNSSQIVTFTCKDHSKSSGDKLSNLRAIASKIPTRVKVNVNLSILAGAKGPSNEATVFPVQFFSDVEI